MAIINRSKIAYPIGFINKFKIFYASASTVNVGIGACRDSTDVVNINNSASYTLDITVSGIGGLSTGSEAANTWYYIYASPKDSDDSFGAWIDPSSTSPTVPTGYTFFKRIGVIRNNNDSNLFDFDQEGLGGEKTYHWQEDFPTTLKLLNGGTSGTFVDVDLSNLIPPISTKGIVCIRNTATGAVQARENGSSLGGGVLEAGGTDSVPGIISTDASQLIEYKVLGAGTANIYVQGFIDEL